MNAYDESSNPIDGAALDRLVAGDLADPERRELLLKLEADPDGWRRCALAFLEDQAWRSALSTPLVAAPLPKPITETKLARKRTWIGRFSVAASILALTFSAGFAAGGMSGKPASVEIAQRQDDDVPEPSLVTETEQVREVGWIDLDDGTSGELPPQRVPIVSGPGLDEKWLRDQAPSVPDYIRARWERQGYQVQERRNLVSVLLEDGRRVSIPVDEVALDYVGQNPL